jgi:hypothetical protein
MTDLLFAPRGAHDGNAAWTEEGIQLRPLILVFSVHLTL